MVSLNCYFLIRCEIKDEDEYHRLFAFARKCLIAMQGSDKGLVIVIGRTTNLASNLNELKDIKNRHPFSFLLAMHRHLPLRCKITAQKTL